MITFSSNLSIAMSVAPVLMEMTVSGSASKSSIRVVNDSKKKLPVEIIIYSLELGPHGEQTKKKDPKDFLIFPPQALIKPGATQTFRIQWVGNPTMRKSQSYIFSVNQVPVKMPKGKSGVQMVYNFGTIVNVSPSSGKSTIELLNTSIVKTKAGKRYPAIIVKNAGNIHSKVSEATIKLNSSGWSKTLPPQYLERFMGVGLVQPGKSRRLLLPVEVPGNVKKITASIDYRPKHKN